jgi:hypothetical protein
MKRRKAHNARHHPPAQEIADEGRAVAGRVHALVMLPVEKIFAPLHL